MKLHFQSDSGVTLVENRFIDQYMSAASGEFVKVYLYLLRCAGSDISLSVSSIADFFDHTEKDVLRALSYWEKQGLLRIERDPQGEMTDVTVLSGADLCAGFSSSCSVSGRGPVRVTAGLTGSSSEAAEKAAEPEAEAPVRAERETPDLPIPDKKALTPARLRLLRSQADIRQLIFVAETYLSRTLSPTEIRNICYYYDGLGFSYDLIEYLIEYCASKGSPGARYMERVAQAWYRAGITTVAQAKKESSLYSKDYYTIFAALGLKNRAPIAAEIEYMDRWLKEWAFPLDVIVEACSRTILQAHQPSFSYAESILRSWMENNVHSLSDVRAADEQHNRRKAGTGSAGTGRNHSTGTGAGSGAAARAGSRFTNFPQRNVDMSALEAKLLDAQEK